MLHGRQSPQEQRALVTGLVEKLAGHQANKTSSAQSSRPIVVRPSRLPEDLRTQEDRRDARATVVAGSRKTFAALVGSPRPHSTSGYFAQYLVEGLAGRGWQATSLTVCAAIRQPSQWPALEAAFVEADAVAIVAPLYVDGVPAELTAALERLVKARSGRPARLFAVVNCGFAEALQNDVALDIYRLFARDAGLHWAGGLAIGSGGMFEGKPLVEQGGRARRITTAFNQTIAAVDAGQDIPESATTGIRRQAIPTWAYFAMANLGMLINAAKHGDLLETGPGRIGDAGGGTREEEKDSESPKKKAASLVPVTTPGGSGIVQGIEEPPKAFANYRHAARNPTYR